jgi:hypothetical protein
MKKSEIYKVAQQAVINSTFIGVDMKLEILRELMDREDTALFVEKREEQEKANEAV